MVEEMRRIFNLSDEDMSIRTRNGSTTQVVDRVGWALQYLRRAMFVEINDGRYHITKRGLDHLNTTKVCLSPHQLIAKKLANMSKAFSRKLF